MLSTKLRQPSGQLRAVVFPIRLLTPETRTTMWTLMESYYAEVTQKQFEKDLNQKDDVILLKDSGDDSLQGFTTVQVYEESYQGKEFVAVYSGDTIIADGYWGQQALHRAFYRYLLQVKLRNLSKPVYWYLISKGYKTYLLLTRNVPNYYPSHKHRTPGFEAGILEQLSVGKFGEAYKKDQGVLHFDTCLGRLKRGVASVDTELLAHDDIRFFVEKNPGHVDGDELCCLGKLDAKLFTSFLFKTSTRPVRKIFRRVKSRSKRLFAPS